MKIDISKVVKSPGSYENVDIKQELLINGKSSWDVDFLEPVSFKGKVENINDVVLLTGTIFTSYKTNCDRCGVELTKELKIEVKENLVDIDQFEENDANKMNDVFTFDGDKLNLQPIVLNYVILNIPMSHLCCETCKGICPNCGQNLNQEECDCSSNINNIDPRLEKLRNLLDK